MCWLVLRSNFALLLTIQFASLFFFYFFFPPRFFYLFFFKFHLFFSPTILFGPFASLITSLINIISLILTTFDWIKVRGIAPRSHTGRPRTCLVIISVIISDPCRERYMVLWVFIFFLFFLFFRHDFVRAISLELSLIETLN